MQPSCCVFWIRRIIMWLCQTFCFMWMYSRDCVSISECSVVSAPPSLYVYLFVSTLQESSGPWTYFWTSQSKPVTKPQIFWVRLYFCTSKYSGLRLPISWWEGVHCVCSSPWFHPFIPDHLWSGMGGPFLVIRMFRMCQTAKNYFLASLSCFANNHTNIVSHTHSQLPLMFCRH